ncbi:MAG: flippase [Eubacteriales bacterium]|nr:flippase [Eubacteriales bacterium]
MAQSHKKNILYNAVYRCVVILTPLITSPYLSRVLGPEKLGVYAYSNSLATYFVIFSLLGVNDYGNRKIAQVKGSREDLSDNFWQIYYMQFILTLLLSVLYFLIVFLHSKYYDVQLILGIYVVSSFFEVSWFAFGMEEFRLTSIRSIIIRIGIVVGIFLFVKDENDVWKYALITAGGNFISLLVVLPLVFKYTDFRKPDLQKIICHIRPNIILFLPVVATSVYNYLDKLMLGVWSTEAEIGYYQNAENIVRLPMFITAAVVTVFEPYSTNLLATGNREKSNSLLNSTLRYTSILNVALAFGLAGIAKTFIPWFLGDGYVRSAELIMILAPMIFICSFSDVMRYQFLLPNEHDFFSLISIVIGAVVNVILNYFLIRISGATGAAVATIIAYVVTMVLQFIYINRKTWIADTVVFIVPYVLFGGLMISSVFCVAGFFTRMNPFAVSLIEIFVGAAVYGILSGIWLKHKDPQLLSDALKLIKTRLFKF